VPSEARTKPLCLRFSVTAQLNGPPLDKPVPTRGCSADVASKALAREPLLRRPMTRVSRRDLWAPALVGRNGPPRSGNDSIALDPKSFLGTPGKPSKLINPYNRCAPKGSCQTATRWTWITLKQTQHIDHCSSQKPLIPKKFMQQQSRSLAKISSNQSSSETAVSHRSKQRTVIQATDHTLNSDQEKP